MHSCSRSCEINQWLYLCCRPAVRAESFQIRPILQGKLHLSHSSYWTRLAHHNALIVADVGWMLAFSPQSTSTFNYIFDEGSSLRCNVD